MQRLAALLIVLLLAIEPACAQFPAKPRRQAPEKPVEKASVMINGQAISPGHVFQELLGAAGPPDHVQAVRSKEVANDYVLFAYDSLGVTAHITVVNNTNNVVSAIVVKDARVKIDNVPFKVGDDYRGIAEIWGQPDRQEPGFVAYWKRGVYVGVGEDGRITNITIAEPGKFDDQTPAAKNG